jgi:hypothetical protein
MPTATDTERDTRTGKSPGEKLLEQIRSDFAYCQQYWRDNYDEAAKDMDCMACIPPPDFVKDRGNRPCIWPDETSQYVNQANNNLRQNKRSIKLSPKTEEATDVDAEHRQAYLRGIEDASHAQTCYTTAFESAVECGFGFWRLTTIVTGPKGEQEPRIRRIPNWATVYMDPDAKEADFSDSSIAFVTDMMRQSVFKRKYPKAKKQSFTNEDREVAKEWFHSDNIVLAEYWTREEPEASDGEKTYKVTQRITNGVEILETNDWLGSWIPIIGVFGQEMYLKTGGASKRVFFSMIRRGRPAQQMMAYIASQETEEIAESPRAAMMGWKGMFDPEVHATIHREPRAYLEFAVPADWNPQWGPPQLPTRSQFSPNIQQYEIAYERWRRSHQAAVAGTPLPTDAQRVNQKSGIALQRIEDAGMLGNFHFTDNFVRALCNTGEQANELITKLAEKDSLPEQVLGKDQKGEDVILHVAPRTEGWRPPVPPESSEQVPEAKYLFAHRGRYTVTIADGSNTASQREEEADFADTLIEELPQMGLGPQLTGKILAIAVKLRNLGAFGDEIADLLSPKDQSAAQLQQAQAQLQQFQEQASAMAAELQQLKLKEAGHVIDNQYKAQFKQMEVSMQGQIAQLNADLKAYIANVTTKAQSGAERDKLFQETQIENHHAAHDVALQKDQQAHEHAMADKNAVIAQAQAAQAAAQQPQTEGS